MANRHQPSCGFFSESTDIHIVEWRRLRRTNKLVHILALAFLVVSLALSAPGTGTGMGVVQVQGAVSLSRNNNARSSGPGGNKAGRSSSSSALSPVKHFQESLTASTAHGTVVAIAARMNSNGNDDKHGHEQPCIVLVSHSPSNGYRLRSSDDAAGAGTTNNTYNNCIDTDIENTSTSGDQVNTVDVDADNVSISDNVEKSSSSQLSHLTALHPQGDGPLLSTSSSFYLLNNGNAIVGMTGFVPDAQHLVKCAVQSTIQYGHLHDLHGDNDYHYDTPGGGTGGGMPLHKLVVQNMARQLQRASLSSGGRPFGVQALLVGPKGPSGAHRGRKGGSGMDVFTVDTAGGWNHWGSGMTAIGRHGASIRKGIVKAMQTKMKEATKAKDVLDAKNNNNKSAEKGDEEGEGCARTSLSFDEALGIAIKCVLEQSVSSEELDQLLLADTLSSKDVDADEKLHRISRQFDTLIFRPSCGSDSATATRSSSQYWTLTPEYRLRKCQEMLVLIQRERDTKHKGDSHSQQDSPLVLET
jgi:20S proteasome alpha/beta subunit